MPIPGYRYYHRYVLPLISEEDKKAYAILTLSLLALIVFGGLAIRPALITLFGLRRELKEGRQLYEQLEDKINNINVASHNLRQLQEQLSLTEQALPDGPHTPELLSTISALFEQNSLIIQTAIVNPVHPHPNWPQVGVVPIHLYIRGPSANVFQTIADLENLLRQSQVAEVRLGKDVGIKTDGRVGILLQIETYHYQSGEE